MAAGTIGGEDSREKIRGAESNKNKVYTRKDQNKPRNPIRQTLASTTNTDDNTSSQPHQAIDMVESDDSSSLNLAEPGAQNVSHENGTSGYVKYDNLAKISLNFITKSEARGIKRKLVSELDQVRTLMKKLEAKEVQFSSGYTRSQFSANEIVDRAGSLVRVNSEVGSVGLPNSRPFCGNSVSVADNMTIHGTHGVDVVGSSGEFVDRETRTPKTNQHYKNSNFSLGKQKSMPTDSNKKLKPNVGKNNGSGMGGESGPDRFPSQLFKRCSNLLGRLMKHKFGWVFNAPVDVQGLGLRDYNSIIKHPMDLGTVKTRLNNHWYKSPRDFAVDVRLAFSNAMLYNTKGQDVHFMAETLSKIFEESWAPIEAEYNPNSRKFPAPSSAPAPTTPAPPPLETRSLERSESTTMPVDPTSRSMNLAPTGRTPAPKKPKAKDPDKRDMTYEEKQRLSISLRNLPSDKIDGVVQIIKKRNPALFQQEDEIEMDIDCVDPETLWKLDRFVTNYKKSLSKIKRKAELALKDNAEPDSNIHLANPRPPAAEAPKAAEAVERKRIVSSSSPVHGEKQGNITSASSSSSGSSTDSGSSSTDSDSDSSSG
ncbi:hypothetical protein SLEP1_g27049 [Rubroshorea leprosula]|uniref:Transcription factor GTE4-like n=1 Tax=Rubroshorea leprosula TaxID=152421 RepID=A0AAV5JYG2_9ROSI|nr:hypothetical protein SLEP1_g27049 [Rubroshorea leprosula]